ncbi:AMP-binding protein [Flagellimonas aequoris]|uniref:AMP-binding protein n=1 Tax=Flagellimonas aequoris TaxID=2306997 RepID=A0A418N4R8_9FLAO|nr:AMP-binding protein [Allomuricauda aequoris]RIV68891.1 O-succinylbenzoic acid--CoA ligase [Allomuricauda aequoris]TXK00595.1 AMP-binding protein [Allomuricauda aequoris]
MEIPIWHNIHPDFKLNRVTYDWDDLSEIGYSLVKEGNGHEIPMGDFLLDWISNRPTLEVFTSGSTGKPKKIVLHKEHMVNSALATGEYFKLRPKQSALLCLPCTGIAGKMMLVRAMVLGLHLDEVEPTSTPLSHNQKQYDFTAMVPLQVQNSLEDLSRIKTLIIGGAPVDEKLRSELLKIHLKAYETYGMTETITHIAVKEIVPKPSPYFETLPHVTLATDDRGCLVIEAPKISEEKVVTNDLVELVSETRFKWLGRYDSVINSGGIKLMPETIEAKLAPVMNSRFFVTDVPDQALGQKLVLVIEGEPTPKEALLKQIKSLKDISKYEVPKEIYFVKSFVETTTQKIHREKTVQQIL